MGYCRPNNVGWKLDGTHSEVQMIATTLNDARPIMLDGVDNGLLMVASHPILTWNTSHHHKNTKNVMEALNTEISVKPIKQPKSKCRKIPYLRKSFLPSKKKKKEKHRNIIVID